MIKPFFCLFVLIGLILVVQKASAQAEGYVSEMETLNNGVLAIQYECDGYGNFDAGDGTTDYDGVSIGNGSQEYGCKIQNPNGNSTWNSTGIFNGLYDMPALYEPVTESGNWQYYASFFVWFWPCDPDTESCVANNGNTYPYEDPWDFQAYMNSPISCPLNELYMGSGSDDWCYGQYTGEDYLSPYSGVAYGYAGNSWGNTGSFYVDALAIGISPSSSTAYGDDSVTFTAEASDTGGFIPAYEWTLISGPGGPATSSGSSYTYTAPALIGTSATATIKGCVINLTTTQVCQTVSVDLIAESITVDPPNPNVLLANGSATSSLIANITDAGENMTVTWEPPNSITSTGNTTATYTAPVSTPALFPTSNTTPVTITASVGSPIVPATTSLTLVEPVTITGVSPATWTAGTTIPNVTITGTGFSANSTVSISSPSWPSMTYACTPTASPTTIPCSITVPANLSNMTASQGATISASTTTSGLTSSYTYATTISIVPVAYTYTISLLPSTSSLTYGYSSTITPVITCKTGNGAACASGVYNPQLANFKIQSGPGSLNCTSNCSSSAFTDNVLIPYPAQNAIVQGCASVQTNICATTNFTIPATTISLNPATMSASLTAGKTQNFSASVQNFGTASGLTWTLSASPSGAAAGTLTSYATTIIGSPTSGTSTNLYTAPATITTPTTVTLTACLTLNTSLCATPVAITLQPAPTFSVTATNNHPTQTALSLGHSMSYTVNVTALYGFTGTETLSVSGLPAGVTASWSNTSIATSGSATLTLQSAYSATTAKGTFQVTITGTSSGTGGNISNSASFGLTSQPLQYAGSCNVPTSISRFYPNPLFPF
jgi:hypothetical protein